MHRWHGSNFLWNFCSNPACSPCHVIFCCHTFYHIAERLREKLKCVFFSLFLFFFWVSKITTTICMTISEKPAFSKLYTRAWTRVCFKHPMQMCGPTVVDGVLWAFGVRAQKLRAKKSLELVNDVVARDCCKEAHRLRPKAAPICSVSLTFNTHTGHERTGTVELTRTISLLGNAKSKFTESRFTTDLRWQRVGNIRAPMLAN